MTKKCHPAWDKDEPYACRYFGADPDGDYCGHPESAKRSRGFGFSTNRMHAEGLCVKGELQLWEARRAKTS